MESDTIFCVRLVSFGTLTLRFIHVVENIGSVGLCVAEFTLHHEYVTIFCIVKEVNICVYSTLKIFQVKLLCIFIHRLL